MAFQPNCFDQLREPSRVNYPETVSGKGTASGGGTIDPGLAGIWVVPFLNGTIPGGVYAFGPAQSYTETIKTDLEDWKVGLRFTPEFQIAQATTAMLGVSISGGSMRLGTHTDFLYSDRKSTRLNSSHT